MKKLAFSLILIFVSFVASAQGFYGEVTVANQLLWRGMPWTPSPTLYPKIGYQIKGLNVYSVAAYAIDDTYREWDLGMSYQLGDVKFEVIDYWYPAKSSEADPENARFDFFNWNNSTTGHQIDCIVYYTPSFVPLKAMASVIPFGNDKLADGKNAFSTYAEIGWYHDFKNESRLEVNLGASFRESNIYGATGFAVVNTEIKYGKTFEFKTIQIPLSSSLIFNPHIKKPFIGVSTGISF